MSGSFAKNKSSSVSQQLTPEQLQAYYDAIDQNTGGRLSAFAKGGTAATNYDALTPDQIRALGGAGASREMTAQRSHDQAAQQIAADPSLDVYQRQRATQLTNQDLMDRMDAIKKESEASLTGLASQEAQRKYQANAANAQLTREDMAAIANIFFGGKGTETHQGSRGYRMAGGIGTGST